MEAVRTEATKGRSAGRERVGESLRRLKLMTISSLLALETIRWGFVILWSRFGGLKGALPWLLFLAAILNALWWVLIRGERDYFRVGYYLWCASFFTLGLACLLRQRAVEHANVATQAGV